MESTVFTHILSFFKQWEGTNDLQMHFQLQIYDSHENKPSENN